MSVWRGFYSYFVPVLGMDSLIRVAVGFGVLSLFSVSACCQGLDEELNRLINSGYLYAGRDSAKALHIAREAALYAEKSNRPDGVIRAKILRAKTYGANQRAEDGISIAEAVLASPIDNKATAVEANQVLGYLYRKNRNYREAVEQDRKTISLSGRDPELLKWKGKAEFNLGYTHKLTSQFDTAMAAYVRALRAFESIPDPAEMIVVYRQMGNLHLVSGNLDRALQVFEQNTKLARQYGDSSDMASNVMNIGVVYHKRHIYPTARSYYLKSLSYSESIPNFLGNAIAYGNIGSSLMDEGKPEEGIPYLLKAKKLKEDFDAAPNNLMHTLFDLSQAYRLAGNFEESKKMAREVIEMARENNDEFSRSIGYKNLASSEYEKGEYRKAYDHFTIHSNINDSLFNAQKSKQIKELEISYETEKKDRAIAGFEQERELEKSRRQNMYIGGLAFLIIGLVFYNQQRLRTKKNGELLVKEKEVDRLKSEFFANVSHEFRTPLTLILGPIQSRLSRTTDPKEREELFMMERNAIRLRRLINDILDLAKFEDGKLKIQAHSTAITDVVKGVAGTFSSLAESKMIDYIVDVEPGINGVIDKNKLETILINLLSNAFKYSDERGAISILAVAKNGILQVAVTDSGKGIPPEKLNRIFERFYQVDDKESRKISGTGIGLSFTKQLVEMHGGRITAQSEMGVGSTFAFEIPYNPENYLSEFEDDIRDIIDTSSLNQIHHQEGAMLPIETLEPNTKLPLILLVEDNPDVLTYIRSILSDSYQLILAQNGKEGLEKGLEYIPDLIISDVMMPVMDGFELCTAIKSDIKTAHIPLILLTAKSSSQSRIRGLEHEADVYMSKPFNPNELELQVRNLLRLRERLREKYRTDASQIIPISVENNSMETRFLEKLAEVMASNYENPEFSAELMSSSMAMSRSQLHRKITTLTGQSTTKFIRTYRLKIAHQLIASNAGTISEIAYRVGFNNVSYFNKCFKEFFAQLPTEISGK